MFQRIVTYFFLLFAANLYAINTHFTATIQSIPEPIQKQMQRYTWHYKCPLPLNQLVYIQMPYWGYDSKIHWGVLIVHKDLSTDVVAIFKKLLEHRFPIQSMRPMDAYKGNDKASMNANNTSAFNCRANIHKPNEFSQHSYGRAIDINPLINPYVDGKTVTPSAGKKFVNRNTPYPGKIANKDYIVRLFRKYGWDWGGGWLDVHDYQHFEKRAPGDIRNDTAHSHNSRR